MAPRIHGGNPPSVSFCPTFAPTIERPGRPLPGYVGQNKGDPSGHHATMSDLHEPSSHPPVKPGDILAGKYRVERILGAGGMGVVVAATHLQLEQKVALKFVLEEALSREAMERFHREARIVAKLKSEHVARMIDVGVLDTGAPFMVMECLDGMDLAALMRERGPLPVQEVAKYLLQACEAIAEAHALGIVHRDLKPQNLFLTARVDGRPLIKVLDFGISKFSEAGHRGDNLTLTRTQAVLGTPYYMSPEQLRTTRNVDARSDIWSLGIILYELLTGRVPFMATSMTELTAMVLQDLPADPRELRSELPQELVEVILRCIEKDPNLRFQSVAALAHALAPFLQHQSLGPAERVLAVARGKSIRPGEPAPRSPRALQTADMVAPTAPILDQPANTELRERTDTSWSTVGGKRSASHRLPLMATLSALLLILLTLGALFISRERRTPKALAGTTTVSAPSQAVPPPEPNEQKSAPAPAQAAQMAPAPASTPTTPARVSVRRPPAPTSKPKPRPSEAAEEAPSDRN